MEERNERGIAGGTGHKLLILNRDNIEITGVTDIVSFDSDEVYLETVQGMLTIQGENMHVSRLALDSGVVMASGNVTAVTYSDTKKVNAGSILSRLFK